MANVADPSPEAFEKWIRPVEAVADLMPALKGSSIAVETILRRLAVEEIVAVARSVTTVRNGERKRLEFQRIPSAWFRDRGFDMSTHTFWRSGDFDFVQSGRDYASSTVISVLDVRFNPSGIGLIFPGLKPSLPYDPGPAVPLASPAALEPEPPANRKPLPPDWLAKWHTAYTANLPAHLDTEPNARRSVDAFFPGHYVGRKALRAIRGPRQRGRPSKGADGE